MRQSTKIWYVAGQRLCNFSCQYCVSVGSWAKSNQHDWEDPRDRDTFTAVVDWIGSRDFNVDVRLGSLGEPFASPFFLERASWLTRQPSVRYVELLSNGSLIKRRLPKIASKANLGKLSLWVTWHESQISLEKLIDAARFAQEEYGCFVVVNTLLFDKKDIDTLSRVRDVALEAGLRFNVDLGYDPATPSTSFQHEETLVDVVPIMRDTDVLQAVSASGGDSAVTEVALAGLSSPLGRPCRAGHDYIFIDIHGQVYRCSRYAALAYTPLGSVLDPDFELPLRSARWAPCEAVNGCCNKEDFLNLRLAESLRTADVPSLGWTNA